MKTHREISHIEPLLKHVTYFEKRTRVAVNPMQHGSMEQAKLAGWISKRKSYEEGTLKRRRRLVKIQKMGSCTSHSQFIQKA